MTDTDTSSALNLSDSFLEGADMSAREGEILARVVAETGFVPGEVIWRSSYWGTKQIGAVHYRGTFEDLPAVLKIQGVKPEISEVFMIGQFQAQNRSAIIRPPMILKTIPWSDEYQFEAIIAEHVTGEKIITSAQLQSTHTISEFFRLYQEYRDHCLPATPWLPQPHPDDWEASVEKALKKSHKAYPDDPRRKADDPELLQQAAKVLEHAYLNVPLEFIHGHFSVEDLIRQDDDVVLFSNLFWKWKYPLYDAVFGYHWFMYELSKIEGITPEQIEEQRKLWLDALSNLRTVKDSKQNQKLLRAALLERAMAGVIIDSLMVDPESPVAEYLVESTRTEIRRLCDELEEEA